MNSETKAAQTVGDYDLRGGDWETFLVGPVTGLTGDADRHVRRPVEHGGMGWDNGFPNWAMYRASFAGDSLYRPLLRDWCVAYAIAHCHAGAVRKGLPVDEIGCLAGWDAYYALLHHKWVIAGMDIADVAGVDPKTYRKVRNHVYGAMAASRREYWELMQIAIRMVAREVRTVGADAPRSRLSDGRGFAHDVDWGGEGCFRARPAAMSDNR